MTDISVLYYGEDKIGYEVVRKEAKNKSEDNEPSKRRKILIKVHPDQRVVVTAPIDATNEMIHDAMIKRARWIWQSLQDFAKQTDEVLPKRYVSGETQFYLGRRYVLKVVVDSEQTASVKLWRGKLQVIVPQSHCTVESVDHNARAASIKSLLDNWYRQRARIIFAERLQVMLPKASWVTDTPSFRIMSMQKQWGSCSIKGNLNLNPHLVKAPKECIDYVILHELCHLKEHNHGEHFWRLLTQVMPNWKEVKTKLDSMAELYLNE